MPVSFSNTPFVRALARLQAQGLLPTSAGTFDLEQIPAEIRERALFSARVANTGFLQSVHDLLAPAVAGGRRDASGAYIPGSYVDQATFRLKIKDFLGSIGFSPETGADGIPSARPGSLKDLSSDARLNLIYQTNLQLAQGYGAHISDQAPARLDAWPAQELYRLESRKMHRSWGQRWNDAIQSLGSNTSAKPVTNPQADGGMFALKNDQVWTAISRFDLPYPPYDFGSGMWVRDISRAEAVELGLMATDDEAPDPAPLNPFNTGLQADITTLAPALQQALSQFGQIINGVFHLANRGTSEGAVKGWETRRSGGWSPTQRQSGRSGLRALSQVLSSKQDVIGAMHREDVGPIDFRWGDDKCGISHIIARRRAQNEAHPKRYRLPAKDVAKRVVVTVAKGNIVSTGQRKIEIHHKGYIAVLAKDWKGKPSNHWVLTGMKREK